ncbi:hypothetical protein H5410_044842 [Solanum commersonii]|uniref:Uncharacterized protein n=1 Tax=Solanum commersonii TaxID=4109 RepID=A0A9J5XC08_SOLCO|nr:hypothetical protein H5410_044842 [Solanum commersonii]
MDSANNNCVALSSPENQIPSLGLQTSDTQRPEFIPYSYSITQLKGDVSIELWPQPSDGLPDTTTKSTQNLLSRSLVNQDIWLEGEPSGIQEYLLAVANCPMDEALIPINIQSKNNLDNSKTDAYNTPNDPASSSRHKTKRNPENEPAGPDRARSVARFLFLSPRKVPTPYQFSSKPEILETKEYPKVFWELGGSIVQKFVAVVVVRVERGGGIVSVKLVVWFAENHQISAKLRKGSLYIGLRPSNQQQQQLKRAETKGFFRSNWPKFEQLK